MRVDGRLVDVRRLGVATAGGAVLVRLAVAARLAEAARVVPIESLAASVDGLTVDVVLGAPSGDVDRDDRVLGHVMRAVGLVPEASGPLRWRLAV